MASNWDKIRKQKATETVKYRDVYEDQQLERSSISKRENMLTRNLLNAVICAVVFALLWFIVSFVQMFFGGDKNIETNVDPRNQWIYSPSYYISKSDRNDIITVDEYNELVYAYNPYIPEVQKPDEPVMPEDPSVKYIQQEGGYSDRDRPDVWLTEEQFNAMMDEFNAKMEAYNADMEVYHTEMEAYEEYERLMTNPEDVYVEINAHYCDRTDLQHVISESDFQILCDEYDAKLNANEFTEDALDFPAKPYDPTKLYLAVEFGDIPKKNTDGEYMYRPVYDEAGNEMFDEQGNPVMELDTIPDQPIKYRNVCTAQLIGWEEFNQMVLTFKTEQAEYEQLLAAHNEKYHPGGNARTMSMAPNKTKCAICFGATGVLFAILYTVFSKNLKAQNLMSDTSDINQYHNDQHVALPEEVQRNYDWFPDVGAHSAVQVSSMISHMALTNKGLKTVQLAKRAEKDIVDEEGNVKYFKGEILEDDNGNPITSTVPMIDEEFMESLFDASGAPKDKNVRKRYDTTKIPYNPDGSNRDKLGKYATVADLINEDWEFPIYEPQRPGGAYIVDTAPVNTMVLAITRAGKGQTVIEPTLDMWMREKRPNNMVVNDPKGELLVKNYVRATVRGLQVVQFNLINAMKTDIYNRAA